MKWGLLLVCLVACVGSCAAEPVFTVDGHRVQRVEIDKLLPNEPLVNATSPPTAGLVSKTSTAGGQVSTSASGGPVMPSATETAAVTDTWPTTVVPSVTVDSSVFDTRRRSRTLTATVRSWVLAAIFISACLVVLYMVGAGSGRPQR